MRLELLGADGLFSAADAAAHGLDGHALGRLARSGECVRLTRGWYAVASVVPPDPEGRHAVTARALGRASAGRAVVSITQRSSCTPCRRMPSGSTPSI